MSRMASSRYQPQSKQLLEAELQATLNLIPAHAWYALPNGQLTFLNERAADYLGLPKDHPLRLGTGSAVDWESHIFFCIQMIAKRHAEPGRTV